MSKSDSISLFAQEGYFVSCPLLEPARSLRCALLPSFAQILRCDDLVDPLISLRVEQPKELSVRSAVSCAINLSKICAEFVNFAKRESESARSLTTERRIMKLKTQEELDPSDEKLEGESKSWALRIPCGEVTLSGDLEIPPNPVGLGNFAHGSGSSPLQPAKPSRGGSATRVWSRHIAVRFTDGK